MLHFTFANIVKLTFSVNGTRFDIAKQDFKHEDRAGTFSLLKLTLSSVRTFLPPGVK